MNLTPRQQQVLALVAEGLTNREIAAKLAIAPGTADFHVSDVLSRLGARSRAHAVYIASQEGKLGLRPRRLTEP